MSNQHDGAMTAAILAATKTAAGLRSTELPGFDPHAVRTRCNHMATEGKIFRAKISHKVARFFDTAERAADYERRNGRDSAKYRAEQQKEAKRQFHAIEPTQTAETKHYIAPIIRHDPRRQVGPGEEVPSIFRSIPLGATLQSSPARAFGGQT